MTFTPIPFGTQSWHVPLNAALTDLQDQIVRQSLDVKTFGAVGDGVTDDTGALGLAISAAQGTGIVLIPAGTYKITSALNIPSGTTIVGDGIGVTIIQQSTTTEHGLTGVDVSTVTLRDFSVVGPGSGSGDGLNFSLSLNGATTFLSFTDVQFSSFGRDGLSIDTPIVSSFRGVLAFTNVRHGFTVTSVSSSTSCAFVACYANGNGQIGYNFTRLFYSTMNGCAADSNGLGYLFTTCSAVNVLGCGAEATVVKNGQDGTNFKTSGGQGVSFIGCSVSLNLARGFWLTGTADSHVVQSCIEQSTSGAPTAFIQVDVAVAALVSYVSGVTANILNGTVTHLGAPGGQTNLGGFLFVAGSAEVAANLIVDTGNVAVATPGRGLNVAEGANARMGTATMNGTTNVVVSTTAVAANSRIFLTTNVSAGTPGFVRVVTRSAGVSFTIVSSAVGDTSTVAWMIVAPA